MCSVKTNFVICNFQKLMYLKATCSVLEVTWTSAIMITLWFCRSVFIDIIFSAANLQCTYQCKSRGGGGGSAGKGQGFDAWDYPPVGLLIVWSDAGVGTFDFDRQKPVINSEEVTKSVPPGFLKVTLLEKDMKFSFVLITIIQYFKLSSKQIMSILRKVLSSSSHLIVKLDWNRIPPWKSEDFLRVTDLTCSDMLSRCYKAFYVSLIL